MHTSTAMKTAQLVAAVALALAMAMLPSPALCAGETTQQQKKKKEPLVTALIVFDDSIVDPGNNNHLLTVVKADHAPYGKDFAGHQPTGHFSNGFIPTDFIAQRLNVKQLLPPYLGVEHTPEDLLTGVSFASSASGFDPLTSVEKNVISMEKQLSYFDEYRGKLVGIVGEEETRRIIGGSLFLVCAGTDDIAHSYYGGILRRTQYYDDISSYVDFLLADVESFLCELSVRGAKRVGFIGLPPIGCVPSQRTSDGDCEAERNIAAQLYNSRVQELINRLGNEDRVRFPTLVYIDIYAVLQDLVDNGARYGFTETTKGCCGKGTTEVSLLCDVKFSSVCNNVSDHVFFDSYHPTQRAYKVIVDNIFDLHMQSLDL